MIDAGYSAGQIRAGLENALSAEFRSSLATLENPYGAGNAAEAIVGVLRNVELGSKLICKKFHG